MLILFNLKMSRWDCSVNCGLLGPSGVKGRDCIPEEARLSSPCLSWLVFWARMLPGPSHSAFPEGKLMTLAWWRAFDRAGFPRLEQHRHCATSGTYPQWPSLLMTGCKQQTAPQSLTKTLVQKTAKPWTFLLFIFWKMKQIVVCVLTTHLILFCGACRTFCELCILWKP